MLLPVSALLIGNSCAKSISQYCGCAQMKDKWMTEWRQTGYCGCAQTSEQWNGDKTGNCGCAQTSGQRNGDRLGTVDVHKQVNNGMETDRVLWTCTNKWTTEWRQTGNCGCAQTSEQRNGDRQGTVDMHKQVNNWMETDWELWTTEWRQTGYCGCAQTSEQWNGDRLGAVDICGSGSLIWRKQEKEGKKINLYKCQNLFIMQKKHDSLLRFSLDYDNQLSSPFRTFLSCIFSSHLNWNGWKQARILHYHCTASSLHC